MTVARPLTPDDVGWAVEVLGRRRAALTPYAPVLWRPAADAALRHVDFLAHLLGAGGAHGFRTDDALMIAAPGRDGWVVDDAWAPLGRWAVDGALLADAVAATLGAFAVRVVCPVPEAERAGFWTDRGFVLASSWWHREVPGAVDGVQSGRGPRLTGAEVGLVPAPPVYDPGGPITFVRGVQDVGALDGAEGQARRCGSPLVVVDQPAAAPTLADALTERGFVRHCDFLDGVAGRSS